MEKEALESKILVEERKIKAIKKRIKDLLKTIEKKEAAVELYNDMIKQLDNTAKKSKKASLK